MVEIYFGNFCTVTEFGDNHTGYMGFRSSINPCIITNSGAFKIVVSDLRIQK